MSPTQLSLKKLRDEGYTAWVVETYNHITKQRRDLWNFADILAIRKDDILAVQATSYSNISSRVKKISWAEEVDAVRQAGIRIEVWGWHQPKGKGTTWKLRVVDCS